MTQTRHRRQDDSVPDYSENAGVRFSDGAYDYEYDPNLKLSTTNPNSNEPDDQGYGSGMREDVLDGTVKTLPEEETITNEYGPMTEEERAYLEEHYRYLINTDINHILYLNLSF